MREYEVSMLQSPRVTTDAGVTGSYVDMQGYLMGNREIKLLLIGGVGTTAGSISGSVQSAEDTSGTGLATFRSTQAWQVTRSMNFLASSGGKSAATSALSA